MRAVPIADATRRPSRRRAAVVEDPHIEVVEGTSTANSDAVADALGLLVSWAIRACTHDHPQPCTNESVSGRSPALAEVAAPEDLAPQDPED